MWDRRDLRIPYTLVLKPCSPEHDPQGTWLRLGAGRTGASKSLMSCLDQSGSILTSWIQ